MSKTQRAGEPLELAGGPLGDLSFYWSGDRYVHQWRFGDGQTQVSLISNESSSEVFLPVSPPLQQIHRQSFRDGREVVFGVGMAGRGHWSASFTLVPDLSCWIVELACRAAVEPSELASTYRLNGRWMTADDGALYAAHGTQMLRIEAIVPGSTARFDGNLLKIRPTRSAATTQWAFRLRASSRPN